MFAAKQVLERVPHPKAAWLKTQLSLREERCGYMLSLKRIHDLGDETQQVEQDPKQALLDAYSRVCRSMQNLITQAQAEELAVHNEADVPNSADGVLWRVSVTQTYADLLAQARPFIQGHCNKHKAAVQTRLDTLAEASQGMSGCNPETCWKNGLGEAADVKDVLAAFKTELIDGALINKETLQLKKDI